MERLTGDQPPGQRRDAKILMQADKLRCMPNHPNKTRLKGPTKNRLKGSSFVYGNKKLTHQFQDRLPKSTLPFPFFQPAMSEPWVTDITDIKDHTTVSSLSGGDTHDDTMKQPLTLALIAERYPPEARVHVFTDVSATNVVTNGGARTLVHFPAGQKATAITAVRQHCSTNRTETKVLMLAVPSSVVFLSDVLSVLQTYQNHKLPNMAKASQEAEATTWAVLQWIPAHCAISGNEQAGILAKEGARG